MKSKMKSRKLKSPMPSYYRYLKPGALAQIRNSKITAKSRVVNNPQTLISIYHQQIEVPTPTPTMDIIPCFNLKKISNNRPCSLHRKKLSAVAPIFYEPNHDPSLVTI